MSGKCDAEMVNAIKALQALYAKADHPVFRVPGLIADGVVDCARPTIKLLNDIFKANDKFKKDVWSRLDKISGCPPMLRNRVMDLIWR